MAFLGALGRRLAMLFRGTRFDRDLDQEMRLHLDLKARRHAAGGIAADDANHAARRAFGSPLRIREESRDAWGWRWLDDVAQDLRFGLRGLRKNPTFTAAAVITLALGIGANTAIFSVVNAVLLKPAPFEDLDRLVMVWETDRNSGTTREPASVPDFFDFRVRAGSVESLSALTATQMNLTPVDGEPVRLAALRVTPSLLSLFGIEPLAGRRFEPQEDSVGAADIAIVSNSLARRTAGSAAAALGRAIRLDDRAHTIVGVVPDSTDFGTLQLLSAAAYSRSFADRGETTRVDVWIPLRGDPKAQPRENHGIFMIGRLAPGQTASSTERELAAIAATLEQEYPANRGRGVHVEPLEDVVLGRVRPTLYMLLGAVALVLLVACVNVASLLLARGAARAQEIGVRRALGASNARVLRQFAAEALVLTLAAAACGVGLALAGLRLLVAMAPANVPRLATAAIDPRVLAVSLAASLAAAALFGVVPALQARSVDLQSTLKNDGATRGAVGPGPSRLRAALVVGELALAIMLLTGAGLLIRSFWNLLNVDPGFRTGGVLKAEYQLPRSRYPVDFSQWPDFPEQHAFTAAILASAEALPGVDAAAVAGNHPLDPGFPTSFRIVGREEEARAAGWPEISVRRVTPGYFATVGVQLVRGRLLTAGDSTRAAPAALINDATARRFFSERDPLGAQIRLFGTGATIVGVVADEKSHGLSETAPIAVYLPLAQAPSADGAGVLLVRTSGDPVGAATAVRAIIRARDAAIAVFGVETLDRTVSRSVAERRFATLLVGLFAALALALGAIGVHGVLSHDVARRSREIGIRMAFGAERRAVLRLVVGQALVMTALGVAIGAAGSLALTRVLATLLFGVTPHDPATFAAAAGLLTIVALAATAVPAWRAATVDPATALRM